MEKINVLISSCVHTSVGSCVNVCTAKLFLQLGEYLCGECLAKYVQIGIFTVFLVSPHKCCGLCETRSQYLKNIKIRGGDKVAPWEKSQFIKGHNETYSCSQNVTLIICFIILRVLFTAVFLRCQTGCSWQYCFL